LFTQAARHRFVYFQDGNAQLTASGKLDVNRYFLTNCLSFFTQRNGIGRILYPNDPLFGDPYINYYFLFFFFLNYFGDQYIYHCILFFLLAKIPT